MDSTDSLAIATHAEALVVVTFNNGIANECIFRPVLNAGES